MKKHRVTLIASQPLYGSVKVEAESASEARLAALAMADAGEVGWKQEQEIEGIKTIDAEEA